MGHDPAMTIRSRDGGDAPRRGAGLVPRRHARHLADLARCARAHPAREREAREARLASGRRQQRAARGRRRLRRHQQRRDRLHRLRGCARARRGEDSLPPGSARPPARRARRQRERARRRRVCRRPTISIVAPDGTIYFTDPPPHGGMRSPGGEGRLWSYAPERRAATRWRAASSTTTAWRSLRQGRLLIVEAQGLLWIDPDQRDARVVDRGAARRVAR